MSLAIDLFYDELSELLDLPIYLGAGEDELEKEVTDNTHGVTVNLSIANDVEAEDLLHFISKLKENALAAMDAASVPALSLYLWHEEGQIWYSIVNGKYARMPFADEFDAAESEEEVVNDYLAALKKEDVKGKMYVASLERK